MTDWNCVLKQNHETCIHQFLKFQATKNEADFKITSQRKTISKFWTSKKIKTLLLWGWSAVFLWNFYCLFIHKKVCGPHSIAQRWYSMDILCDHDQILYRISWNNFRNFAQGTLKIRFCLPNFRILCKNRVFMVFIMFGTINFGSKWCFQKVVGRIWN